MSGSRSKAYSAMWSTRRWYGLWLLLTLALLLCPPKAPVVTANENLLSASKAMAVVEDCDRLEEDFLSATPAAAKLIYVVIDGDIVPRYWLVLVKKGWESVGLVGIDPYTGEFGVEIRVPTDYEFPTLSMNSVAQALRTSFDYSATDPVPAALLVWLGGKLQKNVWVVPSGKADIGSFLVTPAFGELERRAFSALPVAIADGVEFFRLGDLLPLASASDTVVHNEPDRTGAPREADLPLRITKPPPQPEQRAAVLRPMSTDTSLVTNVPYYDQELTLQCWAYCLAMAHQWWSPRSLGTGQDQANEIAGYLGKGDEGAGLSDVRRVMDNWDAVDSAIPSPNDYQYEDYQLVWGGTLFHEGHHPVEDGPPTGYLDDIKTWINWLNTPVICGVDSRGGGFYANTDHQVLVTGYSDSQDKLYINNPGWCLGAECGAQATVSYNDWNNKYWCAAHQSHLPWPRWRYGMVAGYPGDSSYLTLSSHTTTLSSGEIYDNSRERVYNIGIGISGDSAFEGSDGFGDFYSTYVEIDLRNNSGHIESVKVGGFDYAGWDPVDKVTFEHFTGLAAGGSVSGGEFYIDPNLRGKEYIDITWTAYDADDRFRSSYMTVYVYDDRDGINTHMDMSKPRRWWDSYYETKSYMVYDDDPAAPTYSSSSPTTTTYDPHGSSIELRLNWGDPSGISTVQFSHKYDSGSWSSWESADSSSGSTYYRWIPRSEWITHVGETLYWQSQATDNDDDTLDDSETSITGTFTRGDIRDDDTQGPSFSDHTDSGDAPPGPYSFKVRLSDPSGIQDDRWYPRAYYRWDNSTIDSTHYSGFFDMDWDGSWYSGTFTVRPDRPGHTLYWRVLAYDADNDRSDDKASSWSPVYTGGTIRDTNPPQPRSNDLEHAASCYG